MNDPIVYGISLNELGTTWLLIGNNNKGSTLIAIGYNGIGYFRVGTTQKGEGTTSKCKWEQLGLLLGTTSKDIGNNFKIYREQLGCSLENNTMSLGCLLGTTQ